MSTTESKDASAAAWAALACRMRARGPAWFGKFQLIEGPTPQVRPMFVRELGDFGGRSAVKSRQADGRIQIRRRDTDLRGRGGQPALGLTHVGTAPDERRAVAYRQERRQLRRAPARLEVPRRLGGRSPEHRRELEERGAPLALEGRNAGRDLRDQRLRPLHVELRVAARLVAMGGDIGLVRHHIERTVRDVDLLAQRAHRRVGARGLRGDHHPDTVAGGGHRVRVRVRHLDGPVHPAEQIDLVGRLEHILEQPDRLRALACSSRISSVMAIAAINAARHESRWMG